MSLYGVPSLAINGKVTFEQRHKKVKEFHEDDKARVLIFSNVGAAGLNLAIADVVIFFVSDGYHCDLTSLSYKNKFMQDQPWSAQDERQIIGRAHRQPQKKTVKVIYLLANDSADLLMNDVARGKRNMLDAFVNKELAEG